MMPTIMIIMIIMNNLACWHMCYLCLSDAINVQVSNYVTAKHDCHMLCTASKPCYLLSLDSSEEP